MPYVLRTCDYNMRSYGGFQWPTEGYVEAPDWSPKATCGRGLHGFLNGRGTGLLADWSEDAKWLVVEIDTYVDLEGKVKFPSGNVVFVGDRKSATEELVRLTGDAEGVIGIYRQGGNRSTLTGGYRSTLTGGHDSTLTGGHDSTLTGGDGSILTGGHDAILTGGDWSTLTGGHDSILTGGDGSTLTGGHDSTLTGGYGSILTGGDWSTLTGSNRSTLTGGDWSTLTGGHDSILTGGDGSTLTGGDGSILTGGHDAILTGGDWSTLTGGYGSILSFHYYDNRKRIFTAYVGEDGVEPGVTYRFDSKNRKLIEGNI